VTHAGFTGYSIEADPGHRFEVRKRQGHSRAKAVTEARALRKNGFKSAHAENESAE
jgi:hypothetical protein